MTQNRSSMIDVSEKPNIWDSVFTVHTLVVIGSKEKGGSYNFAPKHMAMPLGFGPNFGFMGTPRKTTYRNIERENEFTVSFPRPSQLTISSLMATRREEDDTKPITEQIPTVEASNVKGQLIKDSYFQLECKLSEQLGKFGEWEIIVGEIVAAYAHEDALRKGGDDMDDARLIKKHPLLAYLHPNRFSVIEDSNAFPFPKDFKR